MLEWLKQSKWYEETSSLTETTTPIGDTMTVGKFSHCFDDLFVGKAVLRIFRDKRRLFDDAPLKDVLRPDATDELVLADTMTVAEAEAAINARLAEGCFADIYCTGSYRLTKELPLKEIKRLHPCHIRPDLSALVKALESDK